MTTEKASYAASTLLLKIDLNVTVAFKLDFGDSIPELQEGGFGVIVEDGEVLAKLERGLGYSTTLIKERTVKIEEDDHCEVGNTSIGLTSRRRWCRRFANHHRFRSQHSPVERL